MLCLYGVQSAEMRYDAISQSLVFTLPLLPPAFRWAFLVSRFFVLNAVSESGIEADLLNGLGNRLFLGCTLPSPSASQTAFHSWTMVLAKA